MVRQQLVSRGITDEAVLEAFRTVPRERFVPDDQKPHAWDDRPLPIGHEQTISQPYMVALMLQWLELKPDHRVLDVGTGSGYQAALLSRIVEKVCSIERIAELQAPARRVIEDELGYENVEFRVGDGREGWPDQAPFDRIVVAASTTEIPDPLVEQLADPGRLAIPVGPPGMQRMILVDKKDGHLEKTDMNGCVFVRLREGVQ